MNALINIEMHHKMIVAVTSTGSAKVRATASGILRLDASLSGEPVAGAFGCRANHPDGELFLTWYVADGGYHS